MQSRLNVSLCSDIRITFIALATGQQQCSDHWNWLCTQDVEYVFHLITELTVAMDLSVLYKIESNFGWLFLHAMKAIQLRPNRMDSLERQYWEANTKEMHTLTIDFGSSIFCKVCRNNANIWSNPISMKMLSLNFKAYGQCDWMDGQVQCFFENSCDQFKLNIEISRFASVPSALSSFSDHLSNWCEYCLRL